jgi:hypothetical protein
VERISILFLPVLAITGVDVDGDGSALKEFIEAEHQEVRVDPFSNLTVTFDGYEARRCHPLLTYPLIDTFP